MSAFDDLEDAQRVALFLLSLVARPLPDDFPDPDAESVSIHRADLLTLARDSGIPFGRNTFHAALDDLVVDDPAPAIQLVRHSRSGARPARTARVVLGLLDLADDVDDAWSDLLADVDLEDVEEERFNLTERYGFDLTAPLPTALLSSTSTPIPASKSCPKCDTVKPADAFGMSEGRLISWCLDCKRRASASWKAAHPLAARRAGERHGDGSSSNRKDSWGGPVGY